MSRRPAILCRVGWHARTYTDSDGLWTGCRCGICHAWTTPAIGALVDLRRARVDSSRTDRRSRFEKLLDDPDAYWAEAEAVAHAEIAAEDEQRRLRH